MYLGIIQSKDILIALVTGVIAYLSATLQTIGAFRRERRKALNGVLYSLLEIRWEIIASDPKLVNEFLRRLIEERFGKESTSILETSEVQSLVGQLLDTRVPFLETEGLASRYAEAIETLVPFCPLIAHRLAGTKIVNLDQSLRKYYQSSRRHPAVTLDPNAPAAITRLETSTIEQAFCEGTQKLTSDVKRIAWELGPLTGVKALLELKRQDRRFSTDEFYDLFNRVVSPVLPQVAGTLTPVGVPQSSAPTG